MTDFIEELKNKGYFYQCTDLQYLKSLVEHKSPIIAYIGFDCTANSLHIGSLIQIMVLRFFQQRGYKPIIVLGGGTSKIGDPSGKDEARKLLGDIEIEKNITGIRTSLSKFLQFGNDKNDALLLDNREWLDDLKYLDFLRSHGRFFSVNKMLTLDSVKLRLDRNQPMTFLEFNYMLLQSYDFYYLNKHYNCNLQIGGSDQWGNIVMGVDLIKKLESKTVIGLTTPLLTTSSGKKMGKSVTGAVWLNEDMCSPYDFFQYWRNVQDSDVIRFAKLFCEFENRELSDVIELSKDNINEAKKIVAHRITSLCHGKISADNALNTAVQIFENKEMKDGCPTTLVKVPKNEEFVQISELLFLSGLVKSKSDAKRLIRNSGVKLNDVTVEDDKLAINSQDLANLGVKLSVGKKRHMVVKS